MTFYRVHRIRLEWSRAGTWDPGSWDAVSDNVIFITTSYAVAHWIVETFSEQKGPGPHTPGETEVQYYVSR